MPFVKVQKAKAYFKRYQVKFRRRREGKTDYRARKRLVAQDKNKYNSPRYRLVVRFTNKYVIAQIAYATIKGDFVLAAANSSELPRYGLKVGLKNFSAAYATGLLVARRLLQKLELDEVYEGVEEVTGEVETMKEGSRTFYMSEIDEKKRPFRALLDVGIKATTTGARVFAAMKGASDGGLDVPHSEKRFPGYDREARDKEGKKGKYDAEELKAKVYGEHVADYMRYLLEEDPTLYEKQFASFIKEGISADDLEELYQKVHEAIKEDPSPAEKKAFTPDKSYKKKAKDSKAEFDARVAAKKAAILAAKGIEMDVDEAGEEEEE